MRSPRTRSRHKTNPESFQLNPIFWPERLKKSLNLPQPHPPKKGRREEIKKGDCPSNLPGIYKGSSTSRAPCRVLERGREEQAAAARLSQLMGCSGRACDETEWARHAQDQNSFVLFGGIMHLFIHFWINFGSAAHVY